jgi:hypothetical protein
MSQPLIYIQFRQSEIEMAFSSFEEEADLEAVLEMVKELHFDGIPLKKWLVSYGDSTKSSLYRYGLRVPKNVDAGSCTNWLVEQLRTRTVAGGPSFRIDHSPQYDRLTS